MDIKVLQEKGNTVKLLLKGTNHAFVNALRRQIMAGTPVLAIEEVHIYENTGQMFDEMLGHRLGMVPLRMDSRKYKAGDKVKFVLEKEGPCTVYSKDLKSTDPKIEVSDMNVPVTKLGEGQKLRLEMEAVAGTGKQHAKWQPAIASYIELPQVVSEKGAKDKYKSDVLEMIIDGKHRDIILKEGQSVEYDPNSFVFTVESHGNLSPKELFESAVDELKDKMGEFRKDVKGL